MKHIIPDHFSITALILNTLFFLAGIFTVLTHRTFLLVVCLLLISINMLLYWGFICRQNQLQKSGNQSCKTQAEKYNADYSPAQSMDSKSLPERFCIIPEVSSKQPTVALQSIQQILKENEPVINQAQLQISIRCENEMPAVSVPSDIFHLILADIMDNTIKYLPEKGMLTITLSQIENHMLLIWKDNGPGLEAADTDKLCSLNYQGPNKLCGTGLGLAQVHAAVYAYNGTIDIKSSKNNGFALYIWLPLSRQQESECCNTSSGGQTDT